MSNPRQSVAFPEVAVIHKGTPKKRQDGRETLGTDLNEALRVHFLPGTESARQAWHEKHAAELKEYGAGYVTPNGYEVKRLRAIIPANKVWDAWDYGNEAYTAGRRIALANDERYLIRRNPVTGEYIVKDGEPFMKFTPGDVIRYQNNGRDYEVKMKTHGRLRLVMADMIEQGQLVQFILKTTSYYDCENIKRQLAGIQAIADTVNNGSAAGVPFWIYRQQQEVTWNKPDGSAKRISKWFINLQPDPEWVKAAFARMNQFALTGQTLVSAFLPEMVSGSVNPEEEDDDTGDDVTTTPEEFEEGSVSEVGAPLEAAVVPLEYDASINPMQAWAVRYAAEQWGIEKGEAARKISQAALGSQIPKSKFLEYVENGK